MKVKEMNPEHKEELRISFSGDAMNQLKELKRDLGLKTISEVVATAISHLQLENNYHKGLH